MAAAAWKGHAGRSRKSDRKRANNDQDSSAQLQVANPARCQPDFMCDNCKPIKQRIDRLTRLLRRMPCYENPRKEYFAKYYRANRTKKLADAKYRLCLGTKAKDEQNI